MAEEEFVITGFFFKVTPALSFSSFISEVVKKNPLFFFPPPLFVLSGSLSCCWFVGAPVRALLFMVCPCEGAVSLSSWDAAAAAGPQTKEKMIFRALQGSRRRAGGFNVQENISTHHLQSVTLTEEAPLKHSNYSNLHTDAILLGLILFFFYHLVIRFYNISGLLIPEKNTDSGFNS